MTETTAQHTLGPWETRGFVISKDYYGRYGHRSVAIVSASTGMCTVAEARANARLIAAAPDLLAACEATLNAMDAGVINGSVAIITAPIKSSLRAAIAKAKGER